MREDIQSCAELGGVLTCGVGPGLAPISAKVSHVQMAPAGANRE
jgi:hypothetical protein